MWNGLFQDARKLRKAWNVRQESDRWWRFGWYCHILSFTKEAVPM